MDIKEFDVVTLKDGRKATIIEVFKKNAYLSEVFYKDDEDFEIITITDDDISEVTYRHEEHS